MGRRKSRRKIVRPRRTLPKVFQCPRCGAVAVSASSGKQRGKVNVRCTSCGLAVKLEYNKFYQPVDYYARFLDEYERLLATS